MTDLSKNGIVVNLIIKDPLIKMSNKEAENHAFPSSSPRVPMKLVGLVAVIKGRYDIRIHGI